MIVEDHILKGLIGIWVVWGGIIIALFYDWYSLNKKYHAKITFGTLNFAITILWIWFTLTLVAIIMRTFM